MTRDQFIIDMDIAKPATRDIDFLKLTCDIGGSSFRGLMPSGTDTAVGLHLFTGIGRPRDRLTDGSQEKVVFAWRENSGFVSVGLWAS